MTGTQIYCKKGNAIDYRIIFVYLRDLTSVSLKSFLFCVHRKSMNFHLTCRCREFFRIGRDSWIRVYPARLRDDDQLERLHRDHQQQTHKRSKQNQVNDYCWLKIRSQAIEKFLGKVIECQVPLLHQNVTEYWVNLSFKKVINY